ERRLPAPGAHDDPSAALRDGAARRRHAGDPHGAPRGGGPADDQSGAIAGRPRYDGHSQASAALMDSWHFRTSATGSSPRYSYSMFTGMSYLFFFTSCSTSLIGVSPWPHGTFSP